MREVHFYRTATGNCPVEELLDALTGKQAQKVIWEDYLNRRHTQ